MARIRTLEDDQAARTLGEQLWVELHKADKSVSESETNQAGRLLRALLSLLEVESDGPPPDEELQLLLDENRLLDLKWVDLQTRWSASAARSEGDDPLARARDSIDRARNIDIRGIEIK